MAKSSDRVVVEYCPNCDTAIRFKRRPFRGQMVECPECGDILEVISESPLELDWAYGDDDEWADDDTNTNGNQDDDMDFEDYQEYEAYED